jgi:hypothetical protein
MLTLSLQPRPRLQWTLELWAGWVALASAPEPEAAGGVVETLWAPPSYLHRHSQKQQQQQQQ